MLSLDRLTLFEHRNEDRWNTVIFLWAGLVPVADVESFIQQCIEVEIWNLAYGIVYDRYDRFPKEIRRDFIMRISPHLGYICHEYITRNTFIRFVRSPFTNLRSMVWS